MKLVLFVYLVSLLSILYKYIREGVTEEGTESDWF